MKGLVFLGERKMEFRDFPDPVPGPDEVIVRMKASGMCGSDLHHLHEPMRREDQIVIEGHEPCGIIEEVGSAVRPSDAKAGDRLISPLQRGTAVTLFPPGLCDGVCSPWQWDG